MAEKEYRVSANNWFGIEDALAELNNLKWSVAALAESVADKGSVKYEMAMNAKQGIRARIDYLHDSLRRLLKYNVQVQAAGNSEAVERSPATKG